MFNLWDTSVIRHSTTATQDDTFQTSKWLLILDPTRQDMVTWLHHLILKLSTTSKLPPVIFLHMSALWLQHVMVRAAPPPKISRCYQRPCSQPPCCWSCRNHVLGQYRQWTRHWDSVENLWWDNSHLWLNMFLIVFLQLCLDAISS